MKKAARTSLTILVVLLDEIAIVAIVLFVLWRLKIHLPLWVLITVAVGLGAFSLILYKLIAPVMNKKQVTGPEGMIGLEGEVVKPLTPEGLIKVRGELWKAYSTDISISVDKKVVVVRLEGLRLQVRGKSCTRENGNTGKKEAETIPATKRANRGYLA